MIKTFFVVMSEEHGFLTECNGIDDWSSSHNINDSYKFEDRHEASMSIITGVLPDFDVYRYDTISQKIDRINPSSFLEDLLVKFVKENKLAMVIKTEMDGEIQEEVRGISMETIGSFLRKHKLN